ncbi:MAG: hypothetical protein QM778_18440 [Myxococcales bacterium]
MIIACSNGADLGAEPVQGDAGALEEVRTFEAAAVDALPNSDCTLHPQGDPSPEQSVPVMVDEDGVARFDALRATEADDVLYLDLDCRDQTGKTATYTVDLQSEATFTLRPRDDSKSTRPIRPALTGDPMAWSEEALIAGGYGLRPDPVQAPENFEKWLRSVSKPARAAAIHRVDGAPSFQSMSRSDDHVWGGGILLGGAPYDAVSAEVVFAKAVPQGGTTKQIGAYWAGIGGFGNNTLIQSGAVINTSATAASYGVWREYCCGGTGYKNGADNNFYAASPGDDILIQSWACNSKGAFDVNGGYGCFYMSDYTNDSFVSCTLPNGSGGCKDGVQDPKSSTWCCPSLPQPHAFNGNSAEFIYERPSGNGESSVVQSGRSRIFNTMAHSTSLKTWVDFSSDPNVQLRTLTTNDGNERVLKNGAWTSKSEFVFKDPPAPSAFGCGILLTGQGLTPGRSLWSCDGVFQLILQTDGNLVLYQGAKALWSSRTNGKAGFEVIMQSDGNLVLYDPYGTALWASGTNNHPGSALALTPASTANPRMKIIDENGATIWHVP